MKELTCPKCDAIVNKLLPVRFLNRDTLWQCEKCGLKFKTNADGKVKE